MAVRDAAGGALHAEKLTPLTTTPPLPPGPRSWPIVGCLPFLGRDLHNQFATAANTYGPIFKFYRGSKLHVVVNTPRVSKGRGQDLFFSNYTTTWRNLRKIFVSEMLSNKNLKTYSSFRRDEVRKMIKNVFSKIGTNVDINETAFLTQANVVTRMVWEGISYTGEAGIDLVAELRMLASDINKILGQPNLSDLFPILAWFDIQGVERNMKKEHNKLDQIFTHIIEDRIESNSKMSRDQVEHEEKKKTSFKYC
ncbi:hypothetical protein QVD17_03305 [Tagetes erecta]|uniref:Cytochrome P450 n=1 Tax=Tagetes erecta TaxID=13708 RepID=A0AAD8LD99_TARER|nr:hypothetical protein QVD17_03305 [Tagetes erecta]